MNTCKKQVHNASFELKDFTDLIKRSTFQKFMLCFKCLYSYELDSKSCSSASLSQHFFRYLGFGIILYNREILVKSIMREKRVSKSDKEKEKGRNTQQRYTSEYLLKVNP